MISAPDGTGDIYVAGYFTTYNGQPVAPLVRIGADGTLNKTFTLGLNIRIDSPEGQEIMAIGPVDDGSGDIYVAAVHERSDFFPVVRLWKLNADGSIDSSFTPGEVFKEGDIYLNTTIHTIVPVGDGSGRAYVCGAFVRYNGVEVNHIVRVTPTGTLDPTFNSGATSATFAVVPADDGSGDLYVIDWRTIDVIGPENRSIDVYRLNADGSIDSGFTSLPPMPVQFPRSIKAVLPVGDGSGDIFVSGGSIFLGIGTPAPTVNPDGFRGLVRVNSDGTFDLTSPTPAFPGGVQHMRRAADGTRDILILNSERLMRFKADTSIDPGFAIGNLTAAGTLIVTMLPVSDGTGDLYVGGDVTMYNGVSVGNLVRLNANGTLDGR